MKRLSRAEAAGFLLVNDNFCILSHRRPDGDAYGSAAALCLGLRQLGKNAHVLADPAATGRLSRMLDGLTVEEVGEHDTLVAVDLAARSMLPRAFASLADRINLRIDHHRDTESFTEEELVDPDSASCAEVVCDVLTLLGVELDRQIAEAVYVGASTDTGCFRYSNTTAHTFLIASLCVRAGADIYRLNQELFETNSLAKLRMHAWIVENMKLFGDGKLAVVAIPRAVEDLLGVVEDDMDNISAYARTVAGVCMAATLRQMKTGDVKISVRSVPGYDSAALCGKFGGGGHAGAAGASSSLPLAEVAKAVEEEMLKLET